MTDEDQMPDVGAIDVGPDAKAGPIADRFPPPYARAQCGACRHRWTARVAPGTRAHTLKCPSCTLARGVWCDADWEART